MAMVMVILAIWISKRQGRKREILAADGTLDRVGIVRFVEQATSVAEMIERFRFEEK
jgi:hypothetical protein